MKGAEKDKNLKKKQLQVLTKWDRLRNSEEPFLRKKKDLKKFPQVYVERDIATILKQKHKRKNV